MNKFLLPLFLIISSFAFGQGTPCPNYQQFGSGTTRTAILGLAQGQKGVTVGRYADTATANSSGCADYYPGTLIVTDNPLDEIWQRNFNATKWLNRGSSGDIQSFTFITDSSIVICFADGSCDTIPINNFTEIVNNIVQNFNDSTIYNINDSTLIICPVTGACDTIHLGNTNTYNIFIRNDTMFVRTCDSLETICISGTSIGDSCYQQQICDTIPIPFVPAHLFQEGLTTLPGTQIHELGDPFQGGGGKNLYRNTYINADPGFLKIAGKKIGHEPFLVSQSMFVEESPSIQSWNHYGRGYSTGIDENNQVNLYLNYTDPFWRDSTGFLFDRIGYLMNTNGRGGRYTITIDNVLSKQSGYLLHTYDTDNTDAMTIFGTQIPKAMSFATTPAPSSTWFENRIAVFKTTGQTQLPQYLSGAFEDPSPLYIIAQDNEGNLVQYPPGGITPGQGLLFARDDAANNSLANMYFDGNNLGMEWDRSTYWRVFTNSFQVSSIAGQQRITAGTTSSQVYSPNGNNVLRLTNTFNEWLVQDSSIFLNATGGGSASLTVDDDGTIDLSGTGRITLSGSEIYAETIPYNSGAEIVHLGIDTAALSPTFGQIVRKSASALITANNALTMSTTTNVQLGGTLIQNTDIAAANFTLSLNADAAQSNNIFQTKNAAAAIRARITSAAAFSNTGGQLQSEIFGDLAVVSGTHSVVIGYGASGSANNTVSIGNLATASFATGAIAIGKDATAVGGTAIGHATSNTGNSSLAIGNGASTTSDGATAVGTGSTSLGTAAAFGSLATATGANSTALGYQTSAAFLNSIALGHGALATAAKQFVVGENFGGVTDVYIGSGVTPTAPESFTLNASGASGTDVGGANMTLAGGKGAGAGTPGVIIFQTATALGSGTTLQSLANKIQINGSGILAYNGVMPTSGSGGTDSVVKRNSSSGQFYLAEESAGGGLTSASNVLHVVGSDVRFGGTAVGFTTATWGEYSFINTFNSIDSSGLIISSTSTAANNNRQRLVEISLSGANANNNQTTYGLHVTNSHSGSGATNIAIYGESNATAVWGESSGSYGVLGRTTGAGQNGVAGYNTTNGIGVYGEGTTHGVHGFSVNGNAVYGQGNNGYGVYGLALSGISMGAEMNHGTGNTVEVVLELRRNTTDAVSAGIGGRILMEAETSTTANTQAAEFIWKWATSTHASRTTEINITGVTSAATETWLTLGQSGYLKLRPMTVTEAGAIATAEGLIVFVSNTDATFTSVGIWIYQNGAWKAL